jgi:hypothetical protein
MTLENPAEDLLLNIFEWHDWLRQRNLRLKSIRLDQPIIRHDLSRFLFRLQSLIIHSKPTLEILELSHRSDQFTDDSLREIGSCPRLKYFTLRHCQALTCDGLEAFLRMNPQLQRLRLSFISFPQSSADRLFPIIFEACPRVVHLNLSYNEWLTDASLDLIAAESDLKLKYLNISSTLVSTERIGRFIENPPPSLRYLETGSNDLPTCCQIILKFVLPSLQDPNKEIQWLAVFRLWSHFFDFDTILPDLQAAYPGEDFLFHRLVHFLSLDYDSVSESNPDSSCLLSVISFSLLSSSSSPKDTQMLVLKIISGSCRFMDINFFLGTGALPTVISLLRHSDIPNCAAELLMILASRNQDVCKIIYPTCFTEILLNHQNTSGNDLLLFLSQVVDLGLSANFLEIFGDKLDPESQLVVLDLALKIVVVAKEDESEDESEDDSVGESEDGRVGESESEDDSVGESEDGRVGESESEDDSVGESEDEEELGELKLLQFTLGIFFSSDDISSQKACLHIISAYRYTFSCILVHTEAEDWSVLESFIPCIKKHRAHWNVLLPCLSEIIKTLAVDRHSRVPSDLISVLLSLEICREVMTCVLGICEVVIEFCLVNDDETDSVFGKEFLQHLVDNGLLTFLTSALDLKKISPSVLSELLLQIVEVDEKYLEAVTSLELPADVLQQILTKHSKSSRSSHSSLSPSS